MTSQDPRPADGRVTVSAYVAGEESFQDLNGNGIFDKGELQGVADDQTITAVPDYVRSYKDVGERFMDKNVDDATAGNGLGDADNYLVNVDAFEDLNGNGVRDLGDGVYTGLVCDKDTITRGFCKRELTSLFRNVEFIFTGLKAEVKGEKNGGYTKIPLQVLDATTGTWRSDIDVDLRDGLSKYVRILPIHIPSDDAESEAERLKNPIPDSLGSNFGDLLADGLDLRGVNPIPAGSTFAISKTNGGDVTSMNIDGSNCPYVTSGPYPSITRPIFYCFRIDPETSPNNKVTGQLDITIKASGNHQDAMTVSVGVTDNG